jgi:hypothetical protein
MIMQMSTHRVIQLHDLADRLYAHARTNLRGSAKLAGIGNEAGSRYMAIKASRMVVIADRATVRLHNQSTPSGYFAQRFESKPAQVSLLTPYEAWYDSLKPGDPVRIRLPWEDSEMPGGRRIAAKVTDVHPQYREKEGVRSRWKGWSLRVEWEDERSGSHFQHFYGRGSGGPYHVLMHPERDDLEN